MEKLEDEAAAKFISALTKSVQTLCHGFLDFHSGVEIIGYINLNVDKGSKLHYVLEEKVCKNEENSTLFISNSFHAQNQKQDKGKGKDSDSVLGGTVPHRSNSTDNGESSRVSSAISSISTALSRSHEKSRVESTSSAKDTADTAHSRQISNTGKRKASDDLNSDVRSAKSSFRSSPSPVSHFLSHSQSPHGRTGRSSPVDSKPSVSELRGEDTGTVLPQTAGIGGDGSGDIGVNLAGSVLERVDDHSNSDLPDRGDDSDGDLEVTFIKEEYMEGEQSSCQFENSSGQQFGRGTHRRASSTDNMPDASLYPISMHPSASATYVPGAQDMASAQHYGPSTSSQAGASGVRGGWREGHDVRSSLQHSVKLENTPRGFPGEVHGGSALSSGGAQGQGETVEWGSVSSPSPSTAGFQQNSRSLYHTRKLKAASSAADPHSRPSKLFTCQHCGALFKTAHGLKGHVGKVHGDNPNFRCALCGKGFMMKGHYEGHMNMHNNVKPLKCPTCPRTFAYKSSLKFHMKVCGLRAAMDRASRGGGGGACSADQ